MAATPRHLDRLSGVDASFLLQEGASTHMHIGAVATFEGPPPTYAEFLEHIGSPLGSVPRHRQKIVGPPLGTGRPVEVMDEWQPAPEPSAAELLAAGVQGFVDAGREIAGALVGAALRPQQALER